jgi:aerobic C4-dicarboxylate transport protein
MIEEEKSMRSFYKKNSLLLQVVAGLILGAIFGFVNPKLAAQFKPMGDAFINMVKMVIPPIIFVMVTVGIANMGDVKKVGKVGGKAILYFEIVTTIALGFGLLMVNVLKPGVGLDLSNLAKADISTYTAAAKQSHTFVDFLVGIVPQNAFEAFAKGDLLQILFFSCFFGVGLAALGQKGKPIIHGMETISEVLFNIVNYVMKFSPFGVFGAFSFTIGKYGLKTLVPLAKLVGANYLTVIIFIFIILGGIAALFKVKFFSLLRYIKDEIVLVLATSSSETAMPTMMKKLENYGCEKSVVGLVVPTGYSFNLDGSTIYLAMASIFIAQLFGIPLPLDKQLAILVILLVTSKGAAAVTGGAFITLAATITGTNIGLPVEGLALILGVDRFLSMSRAVTNLIGNALATVVVAKWEKSFDNKKADAINSALKNGTLAALEANAAK